MPPSPSSSSVQQARQDLADRLQEIRLDAGLTARKVAHLCGWHESKCSRIEHARTPPSPDDIRAWCSACGAGDQAEDLVASLRAVNSLYAEWCRLYRSGLRQQQVSRMPLYERTRQFRSYSSWLVPGLLQTRAYTTAVLHSMKRRQGVRDDVEEAVSARMDRQRVLRKGDHRFAFVIEESVLRNAVCRPGELAGQLDHLIVCSTLPTMSLGVIPEGTGRAHGPVEGFWIFDEEQVNIELVSSYLTITQPREISQYVRAFLDLSKMAVHGAQARALITAAIRGL